MAKAVSIFNDMKHKEVRPVNEIDKDDTRPEIVTRICIEVLGVQPELVDNEGPLA